MPRFSCFLQPLTAALVFLSFMSSGCIVSTDYTDPTPEKVLPRLFQVLKDPDPGLRRTAAQALGKIASPQAAPALVEALRDPDATVRQQAAWALGRLDPESLGQERSPLAPLLFDPDPTVREAAAEALGQTGDTQAGLEWLERQVLAPGVDPDVKRWAAAALGAMEARSSQGLLRKMLQDRDPVVRRWAAAALAEIGDEQAVPALSELLRKDPDAGVRLEAAFRLGKFAGGAATSALTAALKDRDEDVRRQASAALKDRETGSAS